MNLKTKLWISAAVAAFSLGTAPVAGAAATATGTLTVSAIVLSVCTVSTTPVVFGNYSLTQSDIQGTIVVTCTPDITSYKVGLGAGNGTSSTVSSRKMKSVTTATELGYNLYRDSGRTQNWGETAGTDTLDITGAAVVATYQVYGRLPSNQSSVSPGVYGDTVQVSVFY